MDLGKNLSRLNICSDNRLIKNLRANFISDRGLVLKLKTEHK